MNSLPSSHRSYQGESDLRAMLALVSRRPPERRAAYPFLVDLQEITGTPEGQASIQVWETVGGEVAAFALLDSGFLAFEVSPDLDFEETASQILDWAAVHTGAGCALSANCRAADLARRQFLERRGFSAQAEATIHFSRDLALPIPAAQLPAGFSIRALAGETEAEKWVTLHRAAHGTELMTVAFRLAMLRAPDYRPDLDLVSVAPDGRLAAYSMGHFSVEENRLRGQRVGYTDPVATHPDFQCKGLSRALLLACFQRLKACGMDFAEVSTSSDNFAMIQTAESVGYQPVDRTVFYLRRGPWRP